MIKKVGLIGWKIKLFSKLVSYYDNNQHYKFVYDKGLWRLEVANSAKLIQIVSAEHSSETLEVVPTSDKSALKGIIRLKKEKDQNKNILVSVRQQYEGQTKMNIWGVERSTSIFQIPEMLLLAQSITERQVIQLDEKYFVARRNNVIHSALKLGIINSPERFCASCGITFDELINLHSLTDKVSCYIEMFSTVFSRNLPELFQLSALHNFKPAVIRGIGVLSAVSACYIMISSAYLVWKKDDLANQLSENKNNINNALTTYEKYQVTNAQLNAINDVFEGQFKKSFVFIIIDEIRHAANVSNVSFASGKVIIRGKAESAIAVLELINSSEGVSGAKFEQTIRRTQGIEEFIVSFSFSEHAYQGNSSRDKKAL